MNKTWLYLIAAVAVSAVVFGIYSLVQGSVPAQLPTSGPNVFTGRIVIGDSGQQSFTNLSVLTDEGCTTDPRTGLANCTSKMQTKNGIIAFNYEHDMMAKPCLSIGDKADVQVMGNGSAIVERTYWAGGGA